MGNSLHIVYFIEMKNMHNGSNEKHKNWCKYTKLSRKTNINTHNEFLNPAKDTKIDTILDTKSNDEYIDDEHKLKKWLEYVECW